jgi:hypothetical protein
MPTTSARASLWLLARLTAGVAITSDVKVGQKIFLGLPRVVSLDASEKSTFHRF